jgi:predicted acetyltransferase
MGVEVRAITPAEAEAFARSVTVPFLGRDRRQDVEHNLRCLEPDRAWAAVERDQFVGNASSFTRNVTLPPTPGRPCPVLPLAAVSQVGVHPTHRRRGLLRAMMDEVLADARRRGEPLAGLKASEGGIYGRFGFGLATQVAGWRIDTRRSAFRASPTPAEIRLVDAGEASKLLPGMHERFRTARAGEVSRDDAAWAEWFAAATGEDGDGQQHDVDAPFYAVAGDGLGYVAYQASDTSDGVRFGARADVAEVYAGDAETEAALWRFVLDIDLVTEVVAKHRPVDEPLRWRLADPRQLRVAAVEDLLWVRILDVPVALEARGYTASGRLGFEVVDGDEAVRGKWVLEASSNGASCTRVRAARAGSRAPRTGAGRASAAGTRSTGTGLRLGIAELGSVLLGGVAPSALAAAGRVEADPASLATADRLFCTAVAPFSGTKF